MDSHTWDKCIHIDIPMLQHAEESMGIHQGEDQNNP